MLYFAILINVKSSKCSKIQKCFLRTNPKFSQEIYILLETKYRLIISKKLTKLCRKLFAEESDEYWCFQNYEIVHENYSLPPFPPPLNLIYVLLRQVRRWRLSVNSRRRAGENAVPKNEPPTAGAPHMHTLKPGTVYCKFRTLNVFVLKPI